MEDYYAPTRIAIAHPSTAERIAIMKGPFDIHFTHYVAVFNAVNMLTSTSDTIQSMLLKFRNKRDMYGLRPMDYVNICDYAPEPFLDYGFRQSSFPLTITQIAFAKALVDAMHGRTVDIGPLKLLTYYAHYPKKLKLFFEELREMRVDMCCDFMGDPNPCSMPLKFMLECNLDFKYKERMYTSMIEIRGIQALYDEFCIVLNDRMKISKVELEFIHREIIQDRKLSCLDRRILNL